MNVERKTLNNGYKIPTLGVGTSGCNNLELIIGEGIDVGYRLIDTAFIYKNEITIGKALKAVFEANKIKREDLFIVSKLGSVHHRPADVKWAIRKSLEDLQIDYLDLYLIHSPHASKMKNELETASGNLVEDTSVTIEDTWRAMEELVNQGYTKSIGVSNFNSQQIERILKIATIKPVVNQVECHPYFSQEKLRAYCKQKDIFIMAYSPLNAPDKPKRFEYKYLNLFEEPVIQEVAKKYKKNASQIVLRYLVQCDVIPISRTNNVDHLKSNFNIWDFVIEPEDFEKIKSLNWNARRSVFAEYKDFQEYPFNIEF